MHPRLESQPPDHPAASLRRRSFSSVFHLHFSPPRRAAPRRTALRRSAGRNSRISPLQGQASFVNSRDPSRDCRPPPTLRGRLRELAAFRELVGPVYGNAGAYYDGRNEITELTWTAICDYSLGALIFAFLSRVDRRLLLQRTFHPLKIKLLDRAKLKWG